jgi:serine/threonine-protein kinase RsbW
MDLPEDKIRVQKSTDGWVLQTPGHESYLAQIRGIIADLAQQVGFPDEEVAKIQMAVDEACANVVEHAYAKGKEWIWQRRDPEIRLQVRLEGTHLVIEINDHGQKFDFGKYRPVAIEEKIRQMAAGGYGMAIMRRFMDEVQYSSNDAAGNTLRLVKYLKKP